MTVLSCAFVVLFRTVQYRTYFGGKYYDKFIVRSLTHELLLMLGAILVECVLGLVSSTFPKDTHLVVVAFAWLSLAIGCVLLARMILIGVRGHESLKSQLKRYGVHYPRERVYTGPITEAVVPIKKIRVDNLDLDDSLPD